MSSSHLDRKVSKSFIPAAMAHAAVSFPSMPVEWRECVSGNDAVLRELRGDADGLTTYTRRMATAIVIMSVGLVPSVTP